MIKFLNKFKIPTILGLGIIALGIISGVFLTLRNQTFLSRASPEIEAQNITLSNISDTEVTISYQTAALTPSFITFGNTNPGVETTLDERDSGAPTPRQLHYITIKNLLPNTPYRYRIISGRSTSEILTFITASPISTPAGTKPIIGSVLQEGKPLEEGIAYLSIAGAATQSSLAKSGNFLIPLSQIRNSDLSDSFPLSEDTIAKLTVVSNTGSANMLFRLKDAEDGLPAINIGEDVELTAIESVNEYDLNNDGKINSADFAILLQNLGDEPQNTRADLNNDGVVDQKDLDLMMEQIQN